MTQPDEDQQENTPAATRLYALLARAARVGVIFRRGPTKQVQLIRWDLRNDTFEHGQWLKGRIYERRCDLSPSGRLLVYFAATNRAPMGSWTAVSKPPFLTALALWPKTDSWGGGGIFENEETLLLNHMPADGETTFELAAGFQLKTGMQVQPCGQWSGRGEDDPINSIIRERDGWRTADQGQGQRGGLRSSELYGYAEPRITEKAGPNGRRLQSLLYGVGRAQKAWYDLDHRVVDRDGAVLVDLPGSDWADWDGGDLVFARAGCIYRLAKSDFKVLSEKGEAAFQCLHDFNDARFTPMAPRATRSNIEDLKEMPRIRDRSRCCGAPAVSGTSRVGLCTLRPVFQPAAIMKLPPIADRIAVPTPEEVRNARISAGLTQTQAAQLVCGDGANVYRTWNQYEVPVEQVVHRPIPLGLWELFLLSIGQHPRLKLTRKQLTSFRDKDKRAFATPVHAAIARQPVPSGERGKECVLAKYPHAVCVREEGNFGAGKDRVRYAIMASAEASLILGYGKREAWAWTQANRNMARHSD